MEIEKTNRMNALFEFYAALLTDKQMNYIELYYADDYSLAEIAEEFGVSRQACLLYTSPSPRDRSLSRMPSSA